MCVYEAMKTTFVAINYHHANILEYIVKGRTEDNSCLWKYLEELSEG